MKFATIQTVADRCGVSTATVSAALRNATGTVRFSEKTQARIRETAAELNYSPNRLAQAIRTGIVPVVAVSLHVTPLDDTVINTYLHDTLPAAGLRLHQLGMEMLFLPYTNHIEQIRRLRSLISGRLIGGVVSNFVAPGGDTGLLSFLRETGIPYVLIGQVEDASAISLAFDSQAIHDALRKYAESRTLRNLAWIQGLAPDGKVLLRAGDMGSQGLDAPIGAAQAVSPDTLFVAHGSATFHLAMKQHGIPVNQLILVEDRRLWDGTRPALLVRSHIGRKAEKAVGIVSRWMKSNRPPRVKRMVVALSNDDIQLEA